MSMSEGQVAPIDWAERKAEFIRTGLRESRLSGITELVKCMAAQVDADGCILWQPVPGADLDPQRPSGRLFVAAQWFRDGATWHSHRQELKSVTGRAILRNEPEYVPDYEDHELIDPREDFWKVTGTRAFITVPIEYPGELPGALAVYKKAKNSFTPDERNFIVERARFVPDLYRTILDRLLSTLIDTVSRRLQVAETRPPGVQLPQRTVIEALETICKEVGEMFHSMETSIFLEDRLKAPTVVRRYATTFEPFGNTGPYKKVDPNKEAVPVGLSSWVLAHGRSVQIFDLASWEQDEKQIQKKYPGIAWNDPVGASMLAARELNVEENELPPLSYMAAPLTIGDRVLGVIRCCAAREAPYYYSENEAALLDRVAALISRFWHGWISRQASHEQIESLRDLVAGVNEVNKLVLAELAHPKPATEIFSRTLKVAAKAIPNSDALDVSLVTEDRKTLEFRAFAGRLWSEGSRAKTAERKAHKFPLDDPPTSVVARVSLRGEVEVIPDVSTEPIYSPTFPNIKRMIVAPISSGLRIYGALTIRAVGEEPFQPHARLIAELLARQLGLYHQLAQVVAEMRLAQAELTENVERQRQVTADVAHQLKTPTNLAHNRLQAALQCDMSELARQYLVTCRSQLTRARQLSWSVRLFTQLHEKKRLTANPRLIRSWALNQLLEDALDDIAQGANPDHGIQFRFIRRSDSNMDEAKLAVDHDLFEHAVFNILDNAAKYSFPNTALLLSCGLSRKKDRFFVTVQNQGFRIRKEDLPLVTERGWRGEDAMAVTDEGSGIGLWIVDHVMRAHGGQLIVESEKGGITIVRLFFPLSVRGKK